MVGGASDERVGMWIKYLSLSSLVKRHKGTRRKRKEEEESIIYALYIWNRCKIGLTEMHYGIYKE